MKIDLLKIKIKYPVKPFIDRNSRKDYKVFGYFGNDPIGHITVAMLDSHIEEKDDFWFERKGKLWVSRPVAFYQKTEEEFRGFGVSEKLLVLVNEETKKRYQMPLASGSIFFRNPDCTWKEKGLAERPAKRVWEKLEQEGLAYRRDYQGRPRWVMR